jgi:hypothetical protein
LANNRYTENVGMTYIYALIDPRNNECRYIGKANDPAERLKGHLKYCKIGHDHKVSWLKQLLALGLKPIITELECIPCAEWEKDEQWWISYMKYLGANLTNMTCGGDGVHNMSREIRSKISEKRKKQTISPETCLKISLAAKLRKPISEETRRRLSESAKKRGMPEGIHKKGGEARKGQKKSPEAIKNMSIGVKKWANSPEGKKQLRKIMELAIEKRKLRIVDVQEVLV